ncbi:MAG: transcription-repair coupling factor [Chloroflexi bacterium]|nr:transcription-repair coupling factor [Chloroflexota bacterium]
MKITELLSVIQQVPRYRELLEQIRAAVQQAQPKAGASSLAAGVLEAARPFVIAALSQEWPGPILLVSGSPESARQATDQIQSWSANPQGVLYFHAPDTIFYDRTPWDKETVHARVQVLTSLATMQDDAAPNKGQGTVVTCSAWALMTKSVSPMALRRAVKRLRVGDMVPPHELLEYLVRAGYEPATVVEGAGSFSRRGSILDIYAPNLPQPLRIDFFGDEIDSMRYFDAASQRSSEQVPEVTLGPATEALPEWGKVAATALQQIDLRRSDHMVQQTMLEQRDKLAQGESFPGIEYYLPYLYPRASTLLDFMPENGLVLLDDLIAVRSATQSLEDQALGFRAEMVANGQLPEHLAVPYLTWEDLETRLQARKAIQLGQGEEEEPPLTGPQGFTAAPKYGGRLRDALEDIDELRRKGQRVVVVTRQAERLSDMLRERNIYSAPIHDIDQTPEPGTVTLVDGILAEGWMLHPGRLAVLTDSEVFGWSRPRRHRPVQRRSISPETFFADLKEGDYVVHVDHGIGRYHGMVRKTIHNMARDYLELEYANGDRLYVPIHQADRVSRYLGADERQPYMHRLGGTEWMQVREKAAKATRDIAADLLELYVAREVSSGHAFASDTPWQHELEASFPYEETDDQLQALSEVKADMERAKPMDRLICGDVGYGKTEVALRAAFKAVMNGKQVAVLVPTTVLAQQHFHTFRRRMRAFPVVVEMLSRFRSPQEQDEVLEGLVNGQVDIVIGTHRLLSNDVTFKDLGLLIIDEEQRFGVSHKERLKQMRREVDVLTLTATPIPRTLYMSLSGVRDMSIIDTPPENRLPVYTVVSERDRSLTRKAILREMDRGGQVYYVHNRVHDIYQVADELQEIVPEASIAIGHGQMDEDELAQVMLGFAQGEHDVLLCTTIIESGLDIPNVNTIIIDNADMLGLAQIYQLRGRVGRGANRAYAYLLYKPPLTDIARRRLQTIQEASELGAGFRVAMQDMEIRGAGELLGTEQHGHIAAVGFDLYVRLLQQAVQELRQASGEPMEAMHRAQHAVATSTAALGYSPNIDLPVSAYLPNDFMPDNQLRLRLYRRLARVESMEEVDAMEQEMRDRFGDLPTSVTDLLYLLRVRTLAAEASVQSINANAQEISVALPIPLVPEVAEQIAARYEGVRARGTRIWLRIAEGWRETLLALLRELGQLELVPSEM